MKNFVYTTHPQRVVFGDGVIARLPDEVDALGASRALVLCTPHQRAEGERAAQLLGGRCAGVFHEATMHVPVEVARRALACAVQVRADCAVAIGGGSTIGLGKAIALETGLPVLAVPTTYAGSEMTPIYGMTEDGLKRTGRDLRVLPRTVLYDPTLSLGLPVAMSVTSALNAIAHAAEGLYAQDANPVMSLMAEEGIRALGRAIPGIHAAPTDAAARADGLYGAWLCGMVLGSVGMALHHKLCHTLGGSLDLPHADVHTVVLPHSMAYNAKAAPEAMRAIQRALGLQAGTSAAAGLYDLAHRHGAPVALRDLGMRAEDVERAVDIALTNPYWNPRPVMREPLHALLDAAYAGRRPE